MLADGAKESYQLQFGSNMKDPDSWISEQILPGFKPRAREFMFRTQAVSEKVMLCLARGLGFADDYFIKAHDVSRPEAQSVLRLIHYPAQDKGAPVREGYYRSGLPHAAHATHGTDRFSTGPGLIVTGISSHCCSSVRARAASRSVRGGSR